MFISLLIVILIWEVYWTSRACWAAAKANDKVWFLFMLVFNLPRLPEIYYLKYKIEEDRNKLIKCDE